MTKSAHPCPSAAAVLQAVAHVEGTASTLRRARSVIAGEALLSGPARRRFDGALADAEDVLLDIRAALFLLERGRDPGPSGACAGFIVDRARELVDGLLFAAEAAGAWQVALEQSIYRRLVPVLARSLELVVGLMGADDAGDAAEPELPDAVRRALSRDDLPVM